jgi:drug/metabolite transporter (DMT)-like permease
VISSKFRSDLILLAAAMIWGFAFTAQRAGMEYIGPYTFNAVRFGLGALVMVPFILTRNRKHFFTEQEGTDKMKAFLVSLIVGLVLFGGASFQQLGIQTTTAGKAGFITGLYVVFVPVAGFFLGQKVRLMYWIGMALSAIGLYLLTIRSGFTMETGDFLVFICAVIFTAHVLLIGWLSPRMDSFLVAFIQFFICFLLSLIFAVSSETLSLHKILQAWLPLVYGGVFSVGIAFTLQVIAQKSAHPAYVSIILSLEAVFAAIGGWILLNERLSGKALIGCGLMLCGMIVIQFRK